MVQLCNKDVKSHRSYFCIPPYSYICFRCMHAQKAAAWENSCNGIYMYVCISTIYFTMNMRRWWSYGGCSCA